MNKLLSTSEAAACLGISRRTLERFRLVGEGPCYTRLGRRRGVRYRQEDLDAFVAARVFRSTSEEVVR